MTVEVVPHRLAVQCDGTNGAEIISSLPPELVANEQMSVDSEEGGVVTLNWGMSQRQIPAGMWFVWASNALGNPSLMTDDEFIAEFAKVSDLGA